MGWGIRAALAALVVALVVPLTADADAAQAPLQRATPLLHRDRFADPSVASYSGGFVAIATG